MTKKGQIYVCEICGNKVQVLESGAGTLVASADKIWYLKHTTSNTMGSANLDNYSNSPKSFFNAKRCARVNILLNGVESPFSGIIGM